MSEQSAIEWTESTWNPVTGCTKVSPGCGLDGEATEAVVVNVVAGDETAWPATVIEAKELSPTAAAALDQRIRLTDSASFGVLDAMMVPVVRERGHDFEVLRAIIRLVAVLVVDDLTLAETPSQQLLGNEAVLVDVAPDIGGGMIRATQQDVAVRSDGAATTPIRIPRTFQPRHACIVAHGVLRLKGGDANEPDEDRVGRLLVEPVVCG